MPRAYIALGSNVGDRHAHFKAALAALRSSAGVQLLEYSSFHETEPVGGPAGQDLFLNAAVAIDTSHPPEELLQLLLAIEKGNGRVRTAKNAPRTLDLDLLLYDDLVRQVEDPLIPHPRMHEREFVLAPLAEIAPDAIDHLRQMTIREMLTDIRGKTRSSFHLDGMRAFVTGSTSGIGRATALFLARAGADVVVHGRNEANGIVVRDAIRKLGRRSEFVAGDLSSVEEIDRVAESACLVWNGTDLLVNSAGADVLTGAMLKLPFERKLELLLAVDVEATILLSRWFGKNMQSRGRGNIINIGWDQVATGMEGESGQLFSATKGAVMAFTKSLAKSLAPSVRVNCVAPGWIKTAWGESASDEWQLRVLRETPLSRWGTPTDVAGAIAWLASPAASFVTAQVIRVNGGVV